MTELELPDEDVSLFIYTLKSCSSYDFSDYAEKSLKRRVEKMVQDYKMDVYGLISRIKKDPDFLEKIVREITVNTTELFRDQKVWQTLRFRILPKFKEQPTLNIWHAGCSTGQEVYSMMILLNELGLFEKAKIYATDLNTEVLEAAQKGVYKYRFNIGYLEAFDKVIKENPYNYEDFREVPYSKYFDIDKVQDSIKMKPFLLSKPVFRKHDLVSGGNIFYTKFDIILCRNVLIYFNNKLQNKVYDTFHKSMFDESFLLLGMHESMLGPMTAKFEKKGMYYTKKKNS